MGGLNTETHEQNHHAALYSEFVVSKSAVDFFSPDGLTRTTGLTREHWNLSILKELTDNALDAIDGQESKQLTLTYDGNTLGIFQAAVNGVGEALLKNIYDFNVYVSRGRFIKNPSRGCQGNGLMVTIGLCHALEYQLRWFGDGAIRRVDLDLENKSRGEIIPTIVEIAKTGDNGVEVVGFKMDMDEVQGLIRQYAKCNPDVQFRGLIDIEPIASAKDRIGGTSPAFYRLEDFRELLKAVDQSKSYKEVIQEIFGQSAREASKLPRVDLNHLPPIEELGADLERMRDACKAKPLTILRKREIGLAKQFNASIKAPGEKGTSYKFDAIIEYEVLKLENPNDYCVFECYVNNSITYKGYETLNPNGMRIKVETARTKKEMGLVWSIKHDFKGHSITIHIITAQPQWMNGGKIELDVSSFISDLASRLYKAKQSAVTKLRLSLPAESKKKTTPELADEHMEAAYLEASSNGKYSVTSRQIYYKLREKCIKIKPDWEKKTTYDTFTQNWLTKWLNDENGGAKYEKRINFCERGYYYVGGVPCGIGTESVRRFEDGLSSKSNKIQVSGSTSSHVHIDTSDFNPRFSYNKVLFIEKTGFDAVFRDEKLEEKYNLIIVSGQGFASRAARKLLRCLSKQEGLKIYCMHDLDASGVGIYNALMTANEKGNFYLDIEDIGITPELVKAYGIIPESVTAPSDEALEKMGQEGQHSQRKFLAKGQRVEINAFSTEQILDILDKAFIGAGELPQIDLASSVVLDTQSIAEAALLEVFKERYSDLLKAVAAQIDIGQYNRRVTLREATEALGGFRSEIISQCKRTIMAQEGW